MPNKRKRDILDGFDPNKSDSEDENFEPGEDQPRRTKKKSRSSKPRSSASSRRNKYRGSDIENDDDDLSDSEQEASFGEDGGQDDEEEEDEAIFNATGRRMRKAAAAALNYKESSDDDIIEDSDPPAPAAAEAPQKRPSQFVTLKVPKSLRSRRVTKEPPASSVPTRRSTRARTEETEEPLVELSTSGRHAQPARSSKSKSPEAMASGTRPTRATKGLKRPPDPIQEATQESSSHGKPDPQEAVEDIPGTAEPQEDESDHGAGPGGDDIQVLEVEDSFKENPEPDELPAEGEQEQQEAAADDEDDDDIPITRRTRASRGSISAPAPVEEADDESENNGPKRRLTRKASQRQKSLQEPSSDFEPGDDSGDGDGDGDLSDSDGPKKRSGRGDDDDDEFSSPMPRGRRANQRKAKGVKRTGRNKDSGDEEIELDKDEMAEELEELRESSRSRPRRHRRSPSIIYEEPVTKRRRTAKPVDYSIKAIDPAFPADEEEDEPAPTPARRRGRNGGATAWERNFNTTYGPFGGGGGIGALLGGPWGTGATGGVDSDSSDDEMGQRSGIGGTVGMTPTSAVPPGGGLLPGLAQPHADGLGGIGGATPNVGKLKNQKAFADADPLGVDMNVDFSKIGGLQGHIDQLKEMVQLPLLYPELFLKFHVTPPRGVLFHGPPGTGKTLLARALANSVGSGGRKITFYMRKGADALSKWVGEAEKQLRLLFEEARRTQPSIIFFDEIDGLAPVRSSKQEQIHASIVSTLLALMDGMDGRGQVIVIGATNRPDNIDPALRRPGRFDREFYFPLPDVEGRRAILDIHTKDWGLSDEFKNGLAENTKGYGGADLRALATEAALNAIQRTYPQIYSSKEKLVVSPDRITVQATDFMLSIKKMIPSSERSASSAAAPLPRSVEPLLRAQFKAAIKLIDAILPRKKKTTALEEAMFEPLDDDDHGFGREAMLQEFERSRIFRPRLLLGASPGMGQQYLASAMLHYLEGVHVQNFDLANLLGDGRPLEQVIVSLFTEVKRHKPSVIYIPNVDSWYPTVSEAAVATFRNLLTSIPPTDPIVVLCTSEVEPKELPPSITSDLFQFSRKNRTLIDRPRLAQRLEFFETVVNYIRKSPTEFPDPSDRKRRVLEELPIAPPPPPKPLTAAEKTAQKKVDHHSLNILKTRLQPIMDQINRKYRKFRQPVIQYSQVQYLFDETDPHHVRPDLAEGQSRPFEIAQDKDGVEGLRETATGKFFYNLETTTIEERLSNGFYARPRDFYSDIVKLAKDSKNSGDKERTLKANELATNVEVDIHDIELQLNQINFEELYKRQVARAKEAAEKAKKRAAMRSVIDLVQSDVAGENESDSQGPVRIGAAIPGPHTTAARFQVMSPLSNGHGDSSGAHNMSNGASVPSRPAGEDVQMGGVEDESQPASLNGSMGPPSQLRRAEGRPSDQAARATAGATQISQVSAITTIPPGVSPSAVLNEASTTRSTNTSSKKSLSNWSTQATNGIHNENAEPDNSQLPDTQPGAGASGPSQATSSDEQWPHSQAQGIERGLLQPRNYGIGGIGSGKTSPETSQVPTKVVSSKVVQTTTTTTAQALNESSSEVRSSVRNSGGSGSSDMPRPLIQEGQVRKFLEVVAERTSGCTIEQLEQINRELMDEVWRTRGEWNRMKVLNSLTTVFNETIRDIELLQGMKPSSQEEPVVHHDRPEDGFIRLK